MGYLDELRSLFEQAGDPDGTDPDGTVLATDVEVLDDGPLGMARSQLEGARTGYHEGPEGTFRACGSRYGCGYAEAVAVVDPQTGKASIDINSHLRVSPENRAGARKLFRRLNKTFIVPGLTLGKDDCVHFVPDVACDLKKGDDLEEWLGKGFSTIHANARLVAELEGGRPAWDIWESTRSEDDAEPSMADRLRALLG